MKIEPEVLENVREARAIIVHQAAKLATGQELPCYGGDSYTRRVPKWMLNALEKLHERMRLNAIDLKKAYDLLASVKEQGERVPVGDGKKGDALSTIDICNYIKLNWPKDSTIDIRIINECVFSVVRAINASGLRVIK